MGKYDSVIDGLPPAPIADQKYQDKVNEVKLKLLTVEEHDPETGELTGVVRELKMTPAMLAETYRKLRELDDEIDRQRYKVQVQLTALEQLIAASWESDQEGWGTYGAGPNTVRLESGYAVDVEQTPEGKVEDAEAFRLWCVAPFDKCMICGGEEDALGHEETDEGAEEYKFTHHKFKPGGGLEKKLQLWPTTMNSIAKERTLAGAPPPDGVVVYARTKVKLRKM